MPTGYTAPVKDGTVTEFRDFALLCARAFGALIVMRDEPISAPIPELFEPSDYNAQGMSRAQNEIDRLLAMSDDDKAVAATKAFEDAVASRAAFEARTVQGVGRYQAMLDRVKAWNPPTAEHYGLKDFMIKQLRESIDFDGGTSHYPHPERKQPDEWFEEALKAARDDFARHTRSHAEEVDRVNKRNEWIRALRASLASERGGGE